LPYPSSHTIAASRSILSSSLLQCVACTSPPSGSPP
jgi:hypothetical protein